jgi:hypothetical protein
LYQGDRDGTSSTTPGGPLTIDALRQPQLISEPEYQASRKRILDGR